MKKLSLLAGVLLLSASAFSAVGYINTNEIFQKYSKAQSYISELGKIKQTEEAKLVTDNKKFQEQLAVVQKKGDKATAKEKEDLQKSAIELEKKVVAARELFRKEDIKREQTILQEIRTASEAVIKAKKLDVIVNGTTVIAGGENVTASVLATLEKSYSTKK